ncbi:DSBA oxidoreductase [Fusarium austroafricanum]|uniref:DSBA oxidoreductase n=1 Tax=Fusarium austroafricanum TaxID=2364996 RepID=A0A8H4JAV1_9HYPO|nr:DSBA oxidoreductase [Fusarium austroafricanum]
MHPETIDTVHSVIKSLGQKEGIKYSFNGKIGNTRDIHRLLYLARSKSPEVEERVLSIAFKSHFEEDGDITCPDTLVSYGEKAGISGADVRSWLDNGGGEDEIEQDKLESCTNKITSVPHMLINGRSVSNGVPEVEVLLQIFAKQFSH